MKLREGEEEKCREDGPHVSEDLIRRSNARVRGGCRVLVTKREQQHIFDTLDNLRIAHHAIDIASDHCAKIQLREKSPQQLVVPQIFVDGTFRCGYAAFVEAVEGGQVEELMKGEAREFPLH